jgi:hypothetical protein
MPRSELKHQGVVSKQVWAVLSGKKEEAGGRCSLDRGSGVQGGKGIFSRVLKHQSLVSTL